ncbi:Lipocalin-like domain-containing protein [Dendryphion nanum]|uniref:Lipocalin-like domain-containing protein n=1 Tax=Dendryphion nanum TaxID=256645 RepID=A0A9P9ID29_9PLEO|nr:Lipocalin-like domain-containing protein [Dendryphion nanum]
MVKPPPVSEVVGYLAGVWQLLNITSIHTNGTHRPADDSHPTGVNPAGLIQYTHSGWMAANIQSTTPSHRPDNISYPAAVTDLDSEWAKVGKHIVSYAGHYSVNPWNDRQGNLTHGPLVFAHLPKWTGSGLARNYTMVPASGGKSRKREDDVLQIWVLGKDGWTNNLYWKRTG